MSFMASAELKVPASRDWVLANPWFWMVLGQACTALAWARLQLLNILSLDDTWPAQLFLIALGLLSVGAALRIRLGSSRPVFLGTASRGLILLGLLFVFGLLAFTVTVLLILRIAGVDPFSTWPNKLVILWLIVTPMSVVALQLGLRSRNSSWQMSVGEESSALLAFAALACFFSCRALYLGEGRAEEWDSIRLLVAVMALVAIVAAPLMVVPQNVRRGVVSLLILLHFGGICTAVLAAPPAPWVIQQIWTRIYRPYLEFMYLNNAYHFYAPDPGPARYLWFRLIYEDEKGREVGHWLKVPEFNERGQHQYALALQYSRYMALTENTVATDPPRSLWETQVRAGKDQGEYRIVRAKFYENRVKHAPGYQPMVGEAMPPKGSLLIPFPLPHEQQHVVPSKEVRELLKSFADHVTRIPHPEHPEFKKLGVKMYSLIHTIPPSEDFLYNNAHPADPSFFRPIFLGEYRFGPDGELLMRRNDPFLYWLLPIYKDIETVPGKILIRDYCRRHAGDPYWVQQLDMGQSWNPSIPWIKWDDGK
jgi:hypothetical protein